MSKTEPAPAQQGPVYYAEALDLIADELKVLAPERLEDRRDKMIAVIRMASHWYRQLTADLTAVRAQLEAQQAERDSAVRQFQAAERDCQKYLAALTALRAERDRLDALINNPHTDDFLESVRLEAAHQRERWAAEHDGGKSDADWFWLIGYLAGKALNKPEKRLHHVITTAAAALNWHAHLSGASTSMRPGIADPELAEVRARLALPAWHPIETAPTDGTAVILWSPAELEAVHAWWLPGDGRAYTPCWAAFGSRLVVNPTHWMPLPAPPSGDIPTFITREGHDGTATAPDESDPH